MTLSTPATALDGAVTTQQRAAPRPIRRRTKRSHWLITIAMTIFTVIMLVPIISIILNALHSDGSNSGIGLHGKFTLENFRFIIAKAHMVHYLVNSLLVALITCAIAVLVAAPGGYVLSRGRGRLVSGYSLLLFVIQSFPIVVFLIPLFILFSSLGLVDSLSGLVIIYVAASMSIACWMMAAYFDSIPVSLEEAAWVDGASVLGAFLRIVLRNSLPGIMSVSIFSFLLAWNDYLVALVFLRTDNVLTLPLGLQQFFQQNQSSWGPIMATAVLMMAPPILVFTAFHRYFSVGGIGGSLAGQ
jgi:multiple sugar transport system permease protein